jgi:hypothetical protein
MQLVGLQLSPFSGGKVGSVCLGGFNRKNCPQSLEIILSELPQSARLFSTSGVMVPSE